MHVKMVQDKDGKPHSQTMLWCGKNYIDGKFLTKEEGDEWFNDNHDRYLCSGDHIANMSYLDLMEWNLAEIKQREGGTHAN